jgi:nucleoside-diphosphate-sugar epimerase
VTIVRPFNTYGPRQSLRAVIPTVITQLLAGATAVKLGNLAATRDFVFVEDTVAGFIEIARSASTIGEEINVATEQEISVGDLAALLIERINPAARIVTDDIRLRPERSEVERLLGSSQKLRRLTGWAPRIDLRQGLSATVAWFSAPENRRSGKTGIYHV